MQKIFIYINTNSFKIFSLFASILTSGCISSKTTQTYDRQNTPIQSTLQLQYSLKDTLLITSKVSEESYYTRAGYAAARNESLNAKLISELKKNMRFSTIMAVVEGNPESPSPEGDFIADITISGKSTKTEFWLSLFTFGLSPSVEHRHYICKIVFFDKRKNKLTELMRESDTTVEIFGYPSQSTYETYTKLYADMVTPLIIATFKLKEEN